MLLVLEVSQEGRIGCLLFFSLLVVGVELQAAFRTYVFMLTKNAPCVGTEFVDFFFVPFWAFSPPPYTYYNPYLPRFHGWMANCF